MIFRWRRGLLRQDTSGRKRFFRLKRMCVSCARCWMLVTAIDPFGFYSRLRQLPRGRKGRLSVAGFDSLARRRTGGWRAFELLQPLSRSEKGLFECWARRHVWTTWVRLVDPSRLTMRNNLNGHIYGFCGYFVSQF